MVLKTGFIYFMQTIIWDELCCCVMNPQCQIVKPFSKCPIRLQCLLHHVLCSVHQILWKDSSFCINLPLNSGLHPEVQCCLDLSSVLLLYIGVYLDSCTCKITLIISCWTRPYLAFSFIQIQMFLKGKMLWWQTDSLLILSW